MTSTCTFSGSLCPIITAFTVNIVNPALLLVSGVSLLICAYGIVEFLVSLSRGEKTGDGKQHMLWGAIGMFILLSAFAIFNLFATTVNSFAG